MPENNLKEHLEKIKNAYLKGLYAHFLEIKSSYKKGILESGITEKTLKDLYENRLEALLQAESEGNEQSKIDRKIIDKFEKYIKGKDLVQAFKVPVNFLKAKTTGITRTVYIDLLAFLLDYKPRPYYSSFNKQHATKIADKATSPDEGVKKSDNQPDAATNQEQKESVNNKIPDTKQPKNARKFFRMMWLLVALLAGILLTVIILATNRRTTIEINGEKINLSRQYYYLKDKGKIKILEKDSFQAQIPPVARPVTPVIFDQYFSQQNIDTQKAQYQAIKTAYFKKHPVKIISLKDLKESSEEVVKQPVKTETQVTQKLSDKIKQISITDDNGQPDLPVKNIIEDWLQKKYELINGQSKYQFTKSQDQKRVICRLKVTAGLKKGNDIKHLNQEVTGTGFSQNAARENALMKFRLILENKKL